MEKQEENNMDPDKSAGGVKLDMIPRMLGETNQSKAARNMTGVDREARRVTKRTNRILVGKN